MTEDREQQLDQIIADFLQAQEDGKTVSEADVIAAHPELSDELREFFDDLGQMNQLAGPLAAPVLSRRPVLGKLRYFGDYELLEEIARGGMGIVYKARQTSLNRIVAVKLILSGHLASETDIRRFKTEAESAANLQHPHIVSVHEVGRHEGQSYFSMEYIEGRNLSEIVRDHPLPPKQAAGYVREVAEAIHYAHQQGTLHRDLKPSNVLIDQNDRVQITDFGLAMKVEGDSELTRTGQVLGTPSYMPPEQAQHKRALIGPGSDIYSMGAILYELLTGRPPFRADSPVETLRQVIETEPLSPRLLNPAVPKDLETICLKCLQKEPHKRYATAQQLADDLGRFLQGEPILARPIGRVSRAWRWAKRRPAVAGLSSLLALSLVVGTIISSMFAIESARHAEFFHNEFQRAEGLLDDKTRLADDLEKALGGQKQATAVAEQRRLEAERNAELARRHSYINDMHFIRTEWENNEMGFVRAFLDRQVPEPGQVDLRGFEWYYWDRSCPLKQKLEGHTESVSSVAFSPDGTRIASASSDNTVKLWDAATGNEVLTLTGHTRGVQSVAFSPDGTRIASASGGATVKLWDAVTGQELMTLAGSTSNVWSVAFSPDGTRIASVSGDGIVKLCAVKLWDAVTGKELLTLTGHLGWVRSVAFSPDGTRIASASDDQTVKLWDAVTGKELLTLTGHTATVLCVAFSPDGTRIASASWDRTVKLWDAVTGKELLTLTGHSGSVTCVAFGPDFRQLISGGDDSTIRVWNEFKIPEPRSIDLPRRIDDYRDKLERQPSNLKSSYELAAMLRYTNDLDGYRKVCRNMLDEYSKPDAKLSTHTLLMAYLFFPEGDVTPEILEIAKQHAEGNNLINDRMLGLAYYRRGQDAEALELLKPAAAGNAAPNSKLVSLLSLALVQLRLGHLDDARKTIREARLLHLRSAAKLSDSSDRLLWGVIPSMWREVEQAMELAGVHETMPELPPLYESAERAETELSPLRAPRPE